MADRDEVAEARADLASLYGERWAEKIERLIRAILASPPQTRPSDGEGKCTLAHVRCVRCGDPVSAAPGGGCHPCACPFDVPECSCEADGTGGRFRDGCPLHGSGLSPRPDGGTTAHDAMGAAPVTSEGLDSQAVAPAAPKPPEPLPLTLPAGTRWNHGSDYGEFVDFARWRRDDGGYVGPANCWAADGKQTASHAPCFARAEAIGKPWPTPPEAKPEAEGASDRAMLCASGCERKIERGLDGHWHCPSCMRSMPASSVALAAYTRGRADSDARHEAMRLCLVEACARIKAYERFVARTRECYPGTPELEALESELAKGGK